jgi:hypothetical protein
MGGPDFGSDYDLASAGILWLPENITPQPEDAAARWLDLLIEAMTAAISEPGDGVLV